MDPNLRIAQEFQLEHRHTDGRWSPLEASSTTRPTTTPSGRGSAGSSSAADSAGGGRHRRPEGDGERRWRPVEPAAEPAQPQKRRTTS